MLWQILCPIGLIQELSTPLNSAESYYWLLSDHVYYNGKDYVFIWLFHIFVRKDNKEERGRKRGCWKARDRLTDFFNRTQLHWSGPWANAQERTVVFLSLFIFTDKTYSGPLSTFLFFTIKMKKRGIKCSDTDWLIGRRTKGLFLSTTHCMKPSWICMEVKF